MVIGPGTATAAKQAAEAAAVGASTAVLLALASTIILAVLHLLAPRIRRLPLVPEHATASFAGGIAVAYVFLHLLPELAEGNTEVRELFGESIAPSPLLELAIFVVALVGFSIFYALEHLAQGKRKAAGATATAEPPSTMTTSSSVSAEPAAGSAPVSPTSTVGNSAAGPFWLHLGSFALYNAVITYTLPLTYRTGVTFAVLFTIAMGLHFVLSDRGLEENYGARFDRALPRLLLAGALLAGWALAALFAPTRSVTVSLLTAFLAGSVLLNVFKEEIPSARRSSLPWFLIGLALYAALLAVVTYLGEG